MADTSNGSEEVSGYPPTAVLIAVLILVLLAIVGVLALIARVLRQQNVPELDEKPHALTTDEKGTQFISGIAVRRSIHQFKTDVVPPYPRATPRTLAGRVRGIECEFEQDPIKFLTLNQSRLGNIYWMDLQSERVTILHGDKAMSSFTSATSATLLRPNPWRQLDRDCYDDVIHRGLSQRLDVYARSIMIEASSAFGSYAEHKRLDLIGVISELTMTAVLKCILGDRFYPQKGNELFDLLFTLQELVLNRNDIQDYKGEKFRKYKERILVIVSQAMQEAKGSSCFSGWLDMQSIPVYPSHLLTLILKVHLQLTNDISWMILHLLHDPICLAEALKSMRHVPDPLQATIPYLDLCHRETSRLHSPLLSIKQIQGAYSYNGINFASKSLLAASPVFENMRPEKYSNPGAFFPDRHTDTRRDTVLQMPDMPMPPSLVLFPSRKSVQQHASFGTPRPCSIDSTPRSSIQTIDVPCMSLEASMNQAFSTLRPSSVATSLDSFDAESDIGISDHTDDPADDASYAFRALFSNVVVSTLLKYYSVDILPRQDTSLSQRLSFINTAKNHLPATSYDGPAGLYLGWPSTRVMVCIQKCGTGRPFI